MGITETSLPPHSIDDIVRWLRENRDRIYIEDIVRMMRAMRKERVRKACERHIKGKTKLDYVAEGLIDAYYSKEGKMPSRKWILERLYAMKMIPQVWRKGVVVVPKSHKKIVERVYYRMRNRILYSRKVEFIRWFKENYEEIERSYRGESEEDMMRYGVLMGEVWSGIRKYHYRMTRRERREMRVMLAGVGGLSFEMEKLLKV